MPPPAPGPGRREEEGKRKEKKRTEGRERKEDPRSRAQDRMLGTERGQRRISPGFWRETEVRGETYGSCALLCLFVCV